ncbi:MAG: diguanylate cyclase [Paraclostridium bifermentans]|uniref:GGDEF domain-containing protein n=1 Tax=Paraclostridium bifermentans TaxID=1490 RepID=UPI001D4EF0BA|nr:diguanylate cyclase [Paraclostridium bifermentans]MBS6506893.1 diguanylate cyclase [Paraclostridium bifermentans]MDU3801944.1 diguanylate cyclase [Paraclostridium bifermentans]
MDKLSKKIDSYMIALVLELFIVVMILFISKENTNFLLNFIMLGITFLISITTYIGGIIFGLILTSVAIFLYAYLIFYRNTVLNIDINYISYIWMISMPIICMTSGRLSNVILALQKDNKVLKDKYKNLVTVDEVTGLGNIKHFYSTLEKEMSKSNRHKNKLTLMMIKLPYYKEIRKIIGEEKTYNLVKSVSNIIIDSTRSEDERYYLESDMIGIIMPYTDFDGANTVKERIKKNISELNLELNQGKSYIDIDTKIAIVEYKESINGSIEFKNLCEEELQYDV